MAGPVSRPVLPVTFILRLCCHAPATFAMSWAFAVVLPKALLVDLGLFLSNLYAPLEMSEPRFEMLSASGVILDAPSMWTPCGFECPGTCFVLPDAPSNLPDASGKLPDASGKLLWASEKSRFHLEDQILAKTVLVGREFGLTRALVRLLGKLIRCSATAVGCSIGSARYSGPSTQRSRIPLGDTRLTVRHCRSGGRHAVRAARDV